MKCRYCQSEYNDGAREHVFPKGLGGPNIFMDNVCGNCNQKFSDYERVLMRDSPIAFERSIEGVDGYRHSKIPKGAFLAPILLSYDERTSVAGFPVKIKKGANPMEMVNTALGLQ